MFYKIVYLCYNKPNPSKKKAQILSIAVTEMLAEVFHWCRTGFRVPPVVRLATDKSRISRTVTLLSTHHKSPKGQGNILS